MTIMKRQGLLLLLCAVLLNTLPNADSQVQTLVSSTDQLAGALVNPEVTTILLSESLTVRPSAWPHTIMLTRSVLVTATPEQLASHVYVFLDLGNTVMMFMMQPGFMITFRGLEIYNMYGLVGPSFQAMRQSVGATVVFDRCITRRRVGLPLEAAKVNMVNATRPVGVKGAQDCRPVSNFTFNSTRSPSPICVPNAINQYDYSTTVPADSSLAYQDLYYGGYTFTSVQSYYIVDYAVSFQCMKERPGTDCISLMLQQLDAQSPPPASQGGSGADVTMIVVATVVPTVVVILVVAAIAVYARRHRRRQLSLYGAASDKTSDPEAAAGCKGCLSSDAATGRDSGCVFMGLEENQQLPEWSPLAADLDAEDMEEEERRAQGKDGVKDDGPETSLRSTSEALRSAGPGSCKRTDVASGSDPAFVVADTGPLKPGLSSRMAGDDEGSGTRGACAEADRGGEKKADGEEGAVAGVGGNSGPAGQGGGGGGGRGSMPVSGGTSGQSQPSPDMQAELRRMAQELKANVKDQAIKLEAVIGSGSFGTVYKGTWQGLPVAVKTLVFSASDDSRRRALQEAALCASISHPNIVATYNSELQPLGALGAGPPSEQQTSNRSDPTERELSHILEWRLYIVQEYADGGPLRKLYGNKTIWSSPGNVNMPAVVSLALGVARALTHLHSKRIIHGDLNPSNVLLKRDPGEPSGFAIKVGDFGLSVMLPHERTHLSNLRMGTMFYMCPAVVMKGQVGPSSDVFSLGVILWELYHGRRAGIRTDQGPRYSSIFPAFPPTCPEPYRAVALHCLQRQPQNRPTAEVVQAHLERLLAALPPAWVVSGPNSGGLCGVGAGNGSGSAAALAAAVASPGPPALHSPIATSGAGASASPVGPAGQPPAVPPAAALVSPNRPVGPMPAAAVMPPALLRTCELPARGW